MLAASQELFDHAKQSSRDTFKTTSKKKLTQKTEKRSDELIGNKSANKITKIPKLWTQNTSGTVSFK